VRLAYFGSPADAVPPLRALVDAGHDIALVVTQPDRRRGRGGGLVPSAVKRAALELGLPVRTPQRAQEVAGELAGSAVDLGVVVAFGQLLPPALLAATRHGFVNVHFSLLPRWRGAAPVERAILAGDTRTGVCLMAIDEGLDTGDVYCCESTPIGADETAGELRARLVAIATRLLVDELPRLPGRVPTPQVGEPTYAEKLDPGEFRLDPSRPAAELARIVRAGNPRPGAFLTVSGRRVKVLRAEAVPAGPAPGALDREGPTLGTGDGGLRLREVQPEGRRPMTGAAWWAGLRGVDRVDDADGPGAGPADPADG
jgi:methionyl-tRNA formyltransferase